MIETVEYEFYCGAWVPRRAWFVAECGHIHSREPTRPRKTNLVEYSLADVSVWLGDDLAARPLKLEDR